MREIRIPREYKKYDTTWFFNFIRTHNSSQYIIEYNELVNLTLSIKNNFLLKQVYYIIQQILISDSLKPPINPTPSNGIELRNPNSMEPYSIYHLHLDDGYILVWYTTLNETGYKLKFIYTKHPPANDDYRTIIKNIYTRNDDGFNINIDKYFIDSQNILSFNVNESRVFKFVDFLRKF